MVGAAVARGPPHGGVPMDMYMLRPVFICCILFSSTAFCFRMLDVHDVLSELEPPELTSRRVVDPDRD